MKNNNPALQTVDYVKSYVNLKLDIFLLNISKKMSNAAGYFVFAIIIGFIAIFVSLFLSLSLAAWLADVLNMPGMGNLIVSAIYILLGFILFKFREKLIIKPVSRNMEKLMDFSDLHDESSIGENMDIDTALASLNQKLENTETELENNVNNIKDYYSYEQMKDRFLQSIMNNPKGIINTLLILREIIVSRRKKK
jgi:hypothetical protein